ncbi:MAG: hypothetical protein B7Z38_06050 [Rhodobacterales bacterium 12-64-8]|nr:MAG: hypothetical protein B7Z38_06050 [Rhodobacterales bacterium 12-64-8]OYX45995.1 MAG: hypothetical protein B7Y90_17415 [Alphaproteobacteria bacterium 32-64-14]
MGVDVIAGIVGAIAQSVINATVDKQGKAAPGSGRAYYNAVIVTTVCLMPALFLLFGIASLPGAIQGEGGGWTFVLIGIGGAVAFGAVVAHQVIGRDVTWDDNGLLFRWFRNEANLGWGDIEKVEIRPHNRAHARIRFRDGRTFDVSAQFTGCNGLLRDLARHGVPFHKWGTSQPLA